MLGPTVRARINWRDLALSERTALAALRAGQFLGALRAAGEEYWDGDGLEGKSGLGGEYFRGADGFGVGGAGKGPLFTNPARQQGLGVIAYPLVEQGCHLATDVGGVV